MPRSLAQGKKERVESGRKAELFQLEIHFYYLFDPGLLDSKENNGSLDSLLLRPHQELFCSWPLPQPTDMAALGIS